MTKVLNKFFGAMFALALLASVTSFAGDLKISYEIQKNIVPGVSGYSQAIVDVYLTTGGTTWLESFEGLISPVDGVTFDANTKVTWNESIFVNNATYDYDVSEGDFDFFVDASAAMGVAAIAANAKPVLLLTVSFDVDSKLAGTSQSLPFSIEAAVGRDTTDSATVELDKWLSDESITSIDFYVNDSFNFYVTSGATFETNEDVALTIEATDTSKFTATAWDGSNLSATTDVAFTSAVLADTEAGTIAVSSGNLVFTPAADWNGEVNVTAVGASTTIADASKEVTFTITVNAVDDELELTLGESTLAGTEGEALAGTVTFTAKDVDGDKTVSSSATLTLTGTTTIEVEGTVEAQDTEGNTTTYVFTPASETIDYTAVVHPNETETYSWSLELADGTFEYTLEGEAVITDTDQQIKSVTFAVNGESSALTVKVDDTLEVSSSAEDPDAEDTTSVETQWSTDGKEWTTTQPALSKDASPIYAKGVASSSFGSYTVDSDVVTITVENSAPVCEVTSGQIFIQRGDATEGSVTFTATDADGTKDLRISTDGTTASDASSVEIKGSIGTATVSLAEGTYTVTYTIAETTSTEEDNSDTITFYVTDTTAADFTAVTVSVDYKENPPPVVEDAEGSTTRTIDEVNEDGEAYSFDITVNATDDTVFPAGVGSWTIELPEGWTATAGDQNTGSSDNAWSGSATWTITTAGYDTITGSPRAKSAEFTVKAIAYDVVTQAEAAVEYTITVNDKDRAPAAPTAIAFDPEKVFHGSTLTANASGAENDEDGDTLTYNTKFAWAYSADNGATFTELSETGATLSDEAAFKRGYVIKATAYAVTTPYENDATEVVSEGFEATIIVGNTAPEGEESATWTVVENSETNEWEATFTDVDVDDGVDTLTYEIGALSNPEAGELTLSEDGTTITFTPAADYNTVETEETLTFTVTATDEAGETATTTVTLVITEVNSDPSLAIADVYVLPSDLGTEQTVTATADMGANEDSQVISEATVEVTEDADDIFDVAPAVSYEGKDITVTYTVKADATLGASAKVKVTITDNGTTAGEADYKEATAEFTIFLGASPWYPILSFECADTENHTEGHTVDITGDDGSNYSITLKDKKTSVNPADYVAIGHPGYAPGVALTYTVYVWTQKEGTSKEECAKGEATVSEYDVPSAAASDAAGEVEAGENGFVELPDFSVPMAQNYTVIVKDADGNEVQTIGPVDFEPNADGMILPNVSGLKIQITDAGDYSIEVVGENPAGEGEASELFTVAIEEDSDADLAWNDGSYTPATGDVLSNPSVKFSWPVATGAKSYTLTVTKGDGTLFSETKGLSATSQVLELDEDGDVTPYTWSVSATNGKDTIYSGEYSFTLSEASGDSLIITKVSAGDDGLVVSYSGSLPEGAITFEYQYFDVAGLQWYNGTATGVAGEENELNVSINNASATDDFVVLLLKVGGKTQGDWVIYQLQ